MLTLASTMKTSTGRSMLASTHVCRRIHQRMYSSPGCRGCRRADDAHAAARLEPVDAALDEQDLGRDAPLQPAGVSEAAVLGALPDVGEVEVPQDVRVGDGDLRAEGRVRHHHVHRAELRDLLSASASPGRWPLGNSSELMLKRFASALLAITAFICAARTRNGSKSAPNRFFFTNSRAAPEWRGTLLRRLCADVDAFLGLELVGQVRERRGEEAAGAARRVEHALVGLRVEHRHDELDWAARREVLPAIAAQVGADDLLVGGPLGVDVGAPEVVLRELRHHEGERAVREGDLLVAAEDRGVLLLHLLEEREDALRGSPLTVGVELLVGAGRSSRSGRPRTTLVVRLPLVVHLGEDEVEELPEGRVLRHALVAVDEVVAAPEGGAQHLRVGATELGVRGDVARADRLVGQRPVADRDELGRSLVRLT
jgi:hypothetical protein